MALPGWREMTIRVLAEKIGPAAEIIVDDVLEKQGIGERDMGAAKYLEFLKILCDELPPEVDREAVCRYLRVKLLKRYGFVS